MIRWRRIFFLPFAVVFVFLLFAGAGCPIRIIGDGAEGGGGDGGLFWSEDNGQNWQQRSFVRQEENQLVTIGGLSITHIVFDPLNSETMYLGTVSSGMYKSDNGGEVWRKLPIDGAITDIDVYPETSTIVYAVVGFSVLKSVDGGEVWEAVYTDSRGQLIHSLVIDWFNPAHLIVVTNRQEVLASFDHGVTWQFVGTVPGVPKYVLMDPLDSRVLYTPILGGGLYRSSNSGQDWEPYVSEALAVYPGSANIHSILFYPAQPSIMFMSSDYGLLRYDSRSQELREVSTLVQARALPIATFAVNPVDTDEILFPVGRVIHKTINGGSSWEIIDNFPSSRTIITIVADVQNPGRYFAGTLVPRKK